MNFVITQEYRIVYRMVSDRDVDYSVTQTSSPPLERTLTELIPYTAYEIQVCLGLNNLVVYFLVG